MKDRARRPAAGPRRTPAGAKPLRSPAAAPGRALTQRSSLVEHLDDAPVALDEAWAQATGEAIELPHRDELEQRFGRSLQAVQAHAGPATRTLLDALGAAGAAHGTDVLLDRADAPLELVAHEVAHVLQAGLSPVADFAGILPEGHAAELAADQAAESAASAAPAEAQAMRQGWVALLRTRPAPSATGTAEDSEETPLPAPGEDTDPVVADDTSDDEELESRPVAARPAAPAPAPQDTPDTAATLADEPATADTGPDAEAAGATRTARPASGRTAAGPDRQQEITALLEQGQATWDDAARTAGGHEVDNCPCSAVRPGERPFARGPPLEVPTTQPIPTADAVQPESVDEDTGVLAADEAVALEVARGPPSAAESSAVDAEQLAEVRSLEREIDEEPAPTVPETPVLEATGAADPAAIEERAGLLAAQADTSHAAALARSGEDFGETRLAPSTDPTLGHDTTLGALEVPDLALHDTLPAATLARVATDGNVGALGRNEVLVARDEDLLQCRETTDLQDRTRAAVDGHIEDNDRTLSAMCTRACRAREQQLATGTTGVAERRTRWRAETDRRVRDRTREADDLARTRGEHVRRVRRDTNERASSRLARGRRQADERWRQARQRASHKTHEGRDDSWWQRGIAWFRSQLARLREWIHDFIDGCRRAIHSLLDAARSAAHAIVDAGHRAVSRTIELTRGALDAIADNLPGELGVIASHWRDDAHSFLDTVQARVDTIAEDLHAGVDTAIDGLTVALDQALTDLEQGLDGAVQALDEALQANPLMALLRRLFPALADLVDSGLEGPMRWAAEHVDAWLQAMVQTVGLDRLTASLEELHQSSFCGASDEAAEQQRCEAFNELLQRATGWLDGILQSPAAQAVQARLQASRDAEAERQVDALDDFLGFIGFFVQPLYVAWQAIEGAAGRVMEVLGDVGRTVWRHVAGLLGIDPDVDPLTALRQGVQALWDGVVEATRPLVDGLRAAWQWIRESSPLAPFIDLVAQLPQVWQSLVDFGGQVVDGIGQAMARAAAFFRESVLPLVQSGLQLLGGLLHHAIDIGAAFAEHVFGVLEGLLSWESGLALLDALVHAVQAVLAPVLAALRLFSDCVIAFWHAVADAVSHLLEWIRTFLDICTGIAMALLAPPLSFVTFFAGTVWLYVVPTCCKAPILNFFLDVCIRLIRFLPEPADFMFAALYNGLLGFLETLRSAPDPQKVRAMDLFASIFAGNAEVAAGFAVGLLAGVWESTGGTLIFLVQALVWLVTLPFKLVQWAAGLASGTTEEDGLPTAAGGDEGDGETTADGAPAPGDAVPDGAPGSPLRRAADPPGYRAAAERTPGEPVRATEPLPAADAPADSGADTAEERLPDELPATREDDERARAEPADAAARAEENEGTVGPDTETEEQAEQDGGDASVDEAEAGDEEGEELGDDRDAGPAGPPAAAPPIRGPPVVAAPATASPDRAAALVSHGAPARGHTPAAVRDAVATRPTAAPASAVSDDAVTADADPASADDSSDTAEEPAGGSGDTEEAAPAAPDLASVGNFFHQLATEGFSRDDVRGLLDGVRTAARTLVRSLAQSAARSMLEFLSNPASAFRIGVVLGTIAGMLVVEVLLAVFTGGASTAVSGAKAALMASRGVARLASVVARLRRALQPLIEMVNRIRRAAQGLLSRVMRWMDDVVQWMSRSVRRLVGRGGPRRAPVRRAPVRGPPPRGAPPRPGPARRPAPGRTPGTPPHRSARAGGPRRSTGPRRGARPPAPARRGAPGRRGPGGRGRGPGGRGRGGPDRRHGDRGGSIAARVRLAARAGWRAVTVLARLRVVPRQQGLQTARNAARVAAAGISIAVNARHLGTRMWTLRVRGRRGGRRATATSGRGWFGRDARRQPWYSAAGDQTPRHRQISRGFERRINEVSRRESRHVRSPDRVAHALRADVRRIESAPSPRPLQGIETDIDELHPRRGHNESRRFALRYRLRIAPNSFETSIWAQLTEPRYHGEWAEWNPRHVLLARDADTYMLSSAHDFGPYDLETPRWNTSRHEPIRPPRFRLRPEYARYGGIGGGNSTRRWAACTNSANVRAERLSWSVRDLQFNRGARRADLVNARTTLPGMFSYMEDRRSGASVGHTHGGAARRAHSIAAYQGGRRPRPLRGTLSAEDAHPGSHIASHHVIGAGGIPSRRHVAWRAAFDQQIGPLGLDVTAVSAQGRNGAFESSGAAMSALALAHRLIAGRWGSLRDVIISDDWPDMTGRVDATNTFAVDSTGGRHPQSERPRYLQSTFRSVFTTSFRGVRPLYDRDVTSIEWIGWASRNRSVAQPTRPLAHVVRRSRAFFLVRNTLDPGGWHGWYFHTLYPVN